MPAPHNPFKQALKDRHLQIGCWLGLADPYVAEISANAGFDWVTVDGEHAPNDLRSITAQLQVIQGCPSHAVVRPPMGEAWMIKQLLDAGAQSLVVPMVESGAEAQALVDAVTYPPQGIRGVGAAFARASDFNAIGDYLPTARDEICLVVQIESRKGLDALDDILAVEGIDGVFIGPADLAADMGYLHDLGAAEVRKTVLDTIARIAASDKAAGLLTLDPTLQAEAVQQGACFLATEIDVLIYVQEIWAAAKRAKAHLAPTK